MNQIKKALELKSELDKLRPIKPEDETRIMQKFRLDWNFHSNSLEGNSLTYGETRALLFHGITAGGKPFKDSLEIQGHDEAIKWVEEIIKGDFPLTENFIRQLHQLILKDSYEIDAQTIDGKKTKKKVEIGKYKTQPNHVKTSTGKMFYFAKPEETAAKMHDLIEWFRKKEIEKDVNPIILAAEFHYKFVLIHPFDDGNGRLSRILMNLVLMKFSFPPVIIKSEDKANYLYALTQADAGEIEFFIEYIAKNLVHSLETMIKGATGENIEESSDVDKKIALLEQKIKASSKENAATKNKEEILKIFDNSIIQLSYQFLKECKKFNKFYNESKFKFIVTGKKSQKYFDDLTFAQAREVIDDDTMKLHISYDFKYFIKGSEEFSYGICLQVDCNISEYKIFGLVRVLPITKKYHEQLSDKEIAEIIKSISQHHLDFIEKQIASKK